MNSKRILLIVLALVALGSGWWAYKEGYLSGTGEVVNAEVAQVKQRGVLRVGVDATYYPMESLNDRKEIVGFDPDLAKEIANELGVPLELKNISFDILFNEMNSGKVDMVISSITITDARSKLMSFSKPYFNAGQVLVVKKSDNSITGVADLTNKKVGVQTGTTSEVEAYKYTDKKNVVLMVDYEGVLPKVLSGKIDVLIMDYPAAAGKVSTNPELKIVGQPFTQEFYGVVVAKGKEGLLQPVNKVITRLTDTAGMSALNKKWIK